MTISHSMTVEEGRTFWMVARPTGPSGDLISQAGVSAASLKVFDRAGATPNTALYTKTLATAADPPTGDNCMFAAEQTDGNWAGRSGGYTFWWGHTPAEYALEGGKVYHFEFELTVDALSGQTFPILDDYGVVPMTWVVTVKGRASA